MRRISTPSTVAEDGRIWLWLEDLELRARKGCEQLVARPAGVRGTIDSERHNAASSSSLLKDWSMQPARDMFSERALTRPRQTAEDHQNRRYAMAQRHNVVTTEQGLTCRLPAEVRLALRWSATMC